MNAYKMSITRNPTILVDTDGVAAPVNTTNSPELQRNYQYEYVFKCGIPSRHRYHSFTSEHLGRVCAEQVGSACNMADYWRYRGDIDANHDGKTYTYIGVPVNKGFHSGRHCS
jgi:hypothetical protein